MNLLAVLIAGIAAWIAGGIWYGVLGKHWLAALGKTRAELPSPAIPMVVSFVTDVLMAFVLAWLLGPGPGFFAAIATAAMAWLGFVATSLLVNNAFAGRALMLSVIDAGHWLAALLVAGIVLGMMG